jgi:exoribonuclease R
MFWRGWRQRYRNDAIMAEFVCHTGTPRPLRKPLKPSEAIPAEEVARREDLGRWRRFTVDPHDAKDFDDALSLRKLPMVAGSGRSHCRRDLLR